MAFIEKINSKNVEGIVAEPVRIDKVVQGDSGDYAVIVDRISQDVPFTVHSLKMLLSVVPRSLTIHSGGVQMKNFLTMLLQLR